MKFSRQTGGRGYFQTDIWNESLHQHNNDNGIRTLYFATSKNIYSC